MRSTTLLGFLVLLGACSDPVCRPGEILLGNTCYERTKSDGALPAGADGGSSSPDLPFAVDSGVDALRPADLPEDASSSEQVVDGGGNMSSDAAGPDGADVDTELVDAAQADSATAPAPTCLTDNDGDGFGIEPATAPCPAGGTAPKPGDCNDSAASAFPGGIEACNGIDDDCSPDTPDGLGACGTFQCQAGQCLTTCSGDGDCVSGLHCVNGTCEGTQNGASCNADAQCSSGSCTVAAKCGDKVALNGSCDSPGDCMGGLSCSAAGTCKSVDGTSCTEDNQCSSQACMKTCLASKGGLDASCDSDADCVSGMQCSVLGACKGAIGEPCAQDASCKSSVCIAAKCAGAKQGLDGPCDSASDCDTNFGCNGTVCKRNDAVSCSLDAECLHGACLPTGCGAPVAFKMPCNSNEDCQAGLMCSNTPSRVCVRRYGGECATESDCGEGTCTPEPVNSVLKTICRAPGGYDSYCNGPEDCTPYELLACQFYVSGFRRCKLQIEVDCQGDPSSCASGSCDIGGDGLCDG